MLAVFLLCGDKGDCRCPFTSVCDSTSTSVNCTEIPSLLTLCETVPFQRVLVLLLTPLLLRGALAATLSISMRSYLGLLSAAWGGCDRTSKTIKLKTTGAWTYSSSDLPLLGSQQHCFWQEGQPNAMLQLIDQITMATLVPGRRERAAIRTFGTSEL